MFMRNRKATASDKIRSENLGNWGQGLSAALLSGGCGRISNVVMLLQRNNSCPVLISVGSYPYCCLRV